jgi:rubrerythrin
LHDISRRQQQQEIDMGARLLPLSVAELCGHALELERDAGARFREYAARMRELGAGQVASAFDELSLEQDEEVRALEAASGERRPSELSPWEYAWRLTYMPEGMEQHPRLVPLSAREALQLAVLAKRRAESFYGDVSENARDAVVRSCAAEMASAERRHIQRLERMLANEILQSQARKPSGTGDATLPR